MTTEKKILTRYKLPIAIAAAKLGNTDIGKSIGASLYGTWLKIDLPTESVSDGVGVLEKSPFVLIEMIDILSAFPEIVSAIGSKTPSATLLGADIVFEGLESDYK